MDQETRRDYWQSIVEAQRLSGTSVVAFCKERSVSRKDFYRWVHRFPSNSEESTENKFVDLELPVGAEPDAEIVIDLPFGITLRFRGKLR